MLQKIPFSLGNLASIGDGRVGAAMQKLINECIADIKDRPRLKKKRKVTLVIELDGHGDGTDVEEVKAAFRLKNNLPEMSTREFTLGVTHKGEAWFGADPDNPYQQSLDLEEGKDS